MRTFVIAIVVVLGLAGSVRAEDASPVPLLQSTDPAVREQAVQMILESQDQHLYGHLRISLSYDLSPAVRAAAARAIGALGLAQFTDVVRTVSRRDPDPVVRAAAAQAYEQLWPLEKLPRVAAGLSLLCPGCGHIYLRQPLKGGALLASTGLLLASGLTLAKQGGDDLSLDKSGNVKTAVALPLVMGAQNLWFYSIFAAYRDARLLRHNQGYQYPVSQESLGDLLLAPVNPKVLGRPWFWAGLPVMVGAAVGLGVLLDHGQNPTVGRHNVFDGQGVNFLGRRFGTGAGFALGETYYASLFFSVGMGEEALFRGVVQPSLTESYGPYTGWVLASLIFGAAHIGNFVGQSNASEGWAAVPFITATGAYLGYVSMASGYQLSTSVALHAWYDFLLGTIGFITDPNNQPFAVRVTIPL